MTEKERQQLARDLHYRISLLSPGLPHNEVRLEVDHAILPIITRLMDKVVARAIEQFIRDNGIRRNWESPGWVL